MLRLLSHFNPLNLFRAVVRVFPTRQHKLDSPRDRHMPHNGWGFPNGKPMPIVKGGTALAGPGVGTGINTDMYDEPEVNAIKRRTWMDGIKDKIFSWNFSAFELDKVTNGNPLITVTMALMEVYELLDGWRGEDGRGKLDRETVERFLRRVEGEYLPNPYHNNIHAADVTQTAAVIMQSLAKQLNDIPKIETFCIIMASAVHDLGHLGVNNDFLINSKHPRATTYNDKSVNENYHISRAFELARTAPGCDIFERLTLEEQKKCRKLMIDAVMATDMAIHFDLLTTFNAQLQEKPNLNDWQERKLLYQMVVHLADIANPARPFHLARGWAERVIQEFCDQGDREAAHGLPVSPFCNREIINMPKAQQGFISIFLKPTLMAFQDATPDFTSMALRHLDITISSWQKLEAEGFKM